MNVVQIAIISLVVLLLLLVLTLKVTSYFSSAGKIGACQASILKANVLEQGLFGAAQGLGIKANLDCNDLPDTEIKKNDVVTNKDVNDDIVKSKIANAMLDCWKLTGKGELDPYKKYDGDEAYCFICSDVTFDKDFVEQAQSQTPPYQLNDIFYWLAATSIPGKKTTYFEDFYGVKPDTKTVLEMKNKERPFDISQQYAVVWRLDAAKPGTFELSAIGGSSLLGLAAGAKIGAVVGSAGGPLGTLAGGLFGGLAGGTIGLIGSYKITDKIYEVKNKQQQYALESGIFVIPKSILGEDLTYDEDGKQFSRPFCTKLVNY